VSSDVRFDRDLVIDSNCSGEALTSQTPRCVPPELVQLVKPFPFQVTNWPRVSPTESPWRIRRTAKTPDCHRVQNLPRNWSRSTTSSCAAVWRFAFRERIFKVIHRTPNAKEVGVDRCKNSSGTKMSWRLRHFAVASIPTVSRGWP